MKYYKALISSTNGYITKDNVYKEIDHGNDKNSTTTFVTISDWINTLKTLSREIEFEEVSKQEYLLFKVKELKAKILDKNNGFYVKSKDLPLFDKLLNYFGCTSNINDAHYDLYLEQLSDNCWTHRGYISDYHIKQYKLNLINFKDLIDEIKQIRDE